ncbi:hypothetical protein ARTHRO9AX_220216 [Arthrobacter sp. 9AX]|nr:hypothetical protein ARTHRO9AX_220216 [Arthrobacter sp. 9AX]
MFNECPYDLLPPEPGPALMDRESWQIVKIACRARIDPEGTRSGVLTTPSNDHVVGPADQFCRLSTHMVLGPKPSALSSVCALGLEGNVVDARIPGVMSITAATVSALP